MNDKPVDELSDPEFSRLIEGFITRPDDPVVPTTFLSTLQEFLQKRATNVVELTVEVQGDRLSFAPSNSVLVQGNEFLFGETRFVIKLHPIQAQ